MKFETQNCFYERGDHNFFFYVSCSICSNSLSQWTASYHEWNAYNLKEKWNLKEIQWLFFIFYLYSTTINNCLAAEDDGIYILHGNGHVFHSMEYNPTFRTVFLSFEEV